METLKAIGAFCLLLVVINNKSATISGLQANGTPRVQQISRRSWSNLTSYRPDWTPEVVESSELQPPTSSKNFMTLKQLTKIIKLSDGMPESLNWADSPSRVGPVRSQGHCGSCWAIATAGLLEGQQRLNESETVTQLSVQQLLDCDRIGYNHGCRGGMVDDAIEYIVKSSGLESESGYPYASGSGQDDFKCHHDTSKSVSPTRNFTKPSVLARLNEEQLKQVLASYGPVAVGIYSSMTSMFRYESGVFYDEKCIGQSPDHSVLLVGYGNDPAGGDYWILKNSWGPLWGQRGYFWLARNRDGHCGILTYPTIAL